MKNLLVRTITGTCVVVTILSGIVLHPLTLTVIIYLVLAGSMIEYFRLSGTGENHGELIAGLTGGTVMYLLSALVAAGIIPAKWILVNLFFVSGLIVSGLFRRNIDAFRYSANVLMGIIYLAIPFSLMLFASFGNEGIRPVISLNAGSYSPSILLGFFLLLWINDTFAYLVGVPFGRHRLYEKISPKKSWEGFLGGVIVSMAAAWFGSMWLGILDRNEWVVAALIISVTGTLGDLVESMLKREAGVKDSGKLLPGHGGILDRFDSVMVAFPVFYLYISLLA